MNSCLANPPAYYIEHLRALQTRMRDGLLTQMRGQETLFLQGAKADSLADAVDMRGGDTIYRIDEKGEEIIFAFCDEWAKDAPLVLVAEGIEGAGWRTFPDGANESDAAFLLIVDPIDGTRNIMYNKRSAWILCGIAPNRGRGTTLADIEAACMTEIPTTRAFLSDQLWASKGGGAHREACNLMDGTRQTLPIRPSLSPDLSHGFASLAKFFPTAKGVTADLEERLLRLVSPNEGENPLVFDDQYISTGGQIYEILVGHDRFIADLRPVLHAKVGAPSKLVCHPYDICIELIAREAGVIITDEHGQPLSAPLDIRAPVAWAGYANETLRQLIEPHLLKLLKGLESA